MEHQDNVSSWKNRSSSKKNEELQGLRSFKSDSLCNHRIFSYQVFMLPLKIYKIQRRNYEILLKIVSVNDTGSNTVSRKQLL